MDQKPEEQRREELRKILKETINQPEKEKEKFPIPDFLKPYVRKK